MAQSLIEKLNALVTKTPDEIAAQLHRIGWVKYTSMTEDQYQKMLGKRVVVGADNGGAARPFWIVAGGSQRDPYTFNWGPNRGSGSDEFWFILQEDYDVDPTFPDFEAQRTR